VDHFRKLRRTAITRVFITLVLIQGILIGTWWLGREVYHLPAWIVLAVLCGLAIAMSFLFAAAITDYILEPLRYIWQAILHVSPEHSGTAAPNFEKAKLGRELVTSLALQVYQFASLEAVQDKNDAEHRKAIIQAANVVSHLPLPLFVFNKEQLVTNVSDSALEFTALPSSELLGKPLFDSLDLAFQSKDETLEKWIAECQTGKVTATAYWRHVHVQLKDNPKPKQVDLAAFYNKDNPSGAEFIVTLFDRSEEYNQDDSALDFIAIAVHELRTPLTILRGYIEVFEEEFEGKLDAELTDFMHKLAASAQQLAAFVNNILNVAKVEDNQLVLRLDEEKWNDVLSAALENMKLRAQVREIIIASEIEPNLPTVGVDRVSIYEVIGNLIDNAIKYSGESKKIVVKAGLNKEGLVETTVQDFGVGIPTAVLPSLFEKFSRSHRTKDTTGGTGLGLYLSKAIIGAHGGDIWVRSKEGEGSVFGFTLQPYAKLADAQKAGNKEIVRQAHGWIKNHSLYRR
jgi:signal transduction histidine kinase